MDDSLLVSRAAAGDLDSFGQLYDRHFNRVYDFAWRTLRDAGEAAEATRETFVQVARALPAAARAGGFRAALFTTAHNNVLTRAERLRTEGNGRAAHEEAFGAFDAPDPCLVDDPHVTGGDQELPCLVWEALVELNARDYALLDLHVRQELTPGEIAAVIGASRGNANTLVTRMKRAAEDVVRGYIVARRGGNDCDGLRAIVAQHTFPPYTDAVRDAVSDHLKSCETCQRTAALPSPPLSIFAAFAVASAPFVLKGEVWRSLVEAASPARTPALAAAGAGALPAAPTAPPPPVHAGGAGGGSAIGLPYAAGGEDATRRNMILFAAAAIGMLVFAFVGGALIAGALGGDGGGGAVDDETPTATSTASAPGVQTRTPGVTVDTPTPDPNPSPTVEPDTPTPEPTGTPPPPPPPTGTPVPLPTVALPTEPPPPIATPTQWNPFAPGN